MQAVPYRTLHVESAEDGTVGGSFRSLHDLVSGLHGPEFQPTVLFYQPNRFGAALEQAGIQVVDWQPVREAELRVRREGGRLRRKLAALASIARRRRLLQELGVELLHLNNSPHVGLDDWLPAARSLGIPCVASMRGDVHRAPSRSRRWLMNRYSRVVPVSRYVATGTGFLDAHRVQVIQNGVDLGRIREEVDAIDRSELRLRLGVAPDTFLAVMAGTIREWKGQDRAVEAVCGLPESLRERMILLLVGGWGPTDEPYVAGIRKRIAEAGLEERIRLLGERQDVPALFHAADVAIHASVVGEPFGLVVVEALATGTAVLGASVGGPPEILHDGGGLLHDPEDPEELGELLTTLIGRPERVDTLSAQAVKTAANFCVSRTREEFRGLFLDLLPPR